ncbi:MAG: Tat pathway signal protein [Acidobacteriales bacterium 59-55]|nr:Tat pathway signal protein [Terriglobales bacterium]OJV41522.1 MAG: Tat pathway signal protein [Acidobacteriales bacterium 59-55]
MDRRRFIQGIAIAAAGVNGLPSVAETKGEAGRLQAAGSIAAKDIDVEGHTLLCSFKRNAETWKAYEDLRSRDGAITLISSNGTGRVLTKSAEAVFAEGAPYLGLSLSEIGLSGPDLLAEALLKDGDPDPERVRSAAPPQGTEALRNPRARVRWNTFVGTRECEDTMPVYPGGNTRTYHPVQSFPDLHGERVEKRLEGLLGGWMPAVRKVMPISDAAHDEVIVFGDVMARDKFIVQTWHRTVQVENGKIVKAEYGYSYPAFPPRREDPAPEAFYRGLLEFALYWESQLHDVTSASLPDKSWVDMSKYAFAKEQMVRPGGVYPKYGAVDRDYYGSEYDGFQDIFTSSLYTNLEWGRFEMAGQVFDNYYTDFVDDKGMINMRGPETAQFGLTLSLLARYFNYTNDRSLFVKHRAKIEATAALLTQLHDESLKLPADDAGHGLIHGWNESDACLAPHPMTWWKPYFANSAMAARGLKDIAGTWKRLDKERSGGTEDEWMRHSEMLSQAVTASVQKNIRRDMKPPYIGPLPGATLTFWESLEKEHPSPQQWAHRAYAELLHADVLPPELANVVIDCMRAYGAMTLGVVANVERPHASGRDMLGFISYGYALMLLRLDRIEEYLLFLYSHRFHDHTRGSWTAGEVSGITGGTALFCIPAQLTIPALVRWMLVLEDSDEDRLYLAKGMPRDWVASGKEIRIDQAPTRWGRVDFRIQKKDANRIVATVDFPGENRPKELNVKFRLPVQNTLTGITVNGQKAQIGGLHKDTAIFAADQAKHFEVVAEFS